MIFIDFTRKQIKIKLKNLSSWTEVNVIIFGVLSGVFGIIILMNLAFQEYLNAWVCIIPFIIFLYFCIKEYYTLININDTIQCLNKE